MKQPVVLDDGVFAGRLAVVAGCSDDLGRALSHRLAELGARVVIIGVQDTRLLEIAAAAPNQIETLSLSRGVTGTLAALRDAWDDPAIDYYFDLTPFCLRGEGTKRTVGLSRDLIVALRMGLQRSGTRGMVVFDRQARAEDAPPDISNLINSMAHEIQPAALIGLSLEELTAQAPVIQENDLRAERILSMIHPSVTLTPSEIRHG